MSGLSQHTRRKQNAPARFRVRQNRFSEWHNSANFPAFPANNGRDSFTRAILAPHASWEYCGDAVAAAFSKLRALERPPPRLFVVGPASRVDLRGAIAIDRHHRLYEDVEVSTDDYDTVAASGDEVQLPPDVWADEHSIEMQVAAMCQVWSWVPGGGGGGAGPRIVPVLCGSSAGEACADFLDRNMRTGDVLVATCDFSHDGNVQADFVSLARWARSDAMHFKTAGGSGGFTHVDAPGVLVAFALLSAKRRWVLEPLHYDPSVTKETGVGYVAGAAYGPPETDAELARSCGCFVTLTAVSTGETRGCRGRVGEGVDFGTCVEASRRDAMHDDRFRPLDPTKEAIRETVSVLSPRVPVRVSDLVDRLVPKLHGVVLTFDRGASALFLPEVWSEPGLQGVDAFLSALSEKAAGRADWRSATSAELFTVFERTANA